MTTSSQGEAATMTTEKLKVTFPEMEWRVLKGMRNVIVHEYFGINYEIVWESIQRDVPKWKDMVGNILENHVFE
jgi:uncharacterized protein with HEPN domain